MRIKAKRNERKRGFESLEKVVYIYVANVNN